MSASNISNDKTATATNNTRIERDSMGELAVPADALYGAQTQRAVDNFPVSGLRMPVAFISALLTIKTAAARANVVLKAVDPAMADAIVAACDSLLAMPVAERMSHFPVDIYQTGSGTSSNMNANEVIATLATRGLGKPVSANDHVNYGQSSNDVIPTALHVSAALALNNELLPALKHLVQVTRMKARAVHRHVKTGRTHLMDAMPVRMSQVLNGWASQVQTGIDHLELLQPSLQSLAQGGTAVGTGVNADPAFAPEFARQLSSITGLTFEPADDFFAAMGSQDVAVAVSGQLKATAVSLMKISNDLRWMNSGPLAGLGEIELEALQPGSSIMPGKVNPVIPEATAMVAAQVIGNDATITIAGQSGNFELNVMLPVIARNLLESIALLASTSRLLADKAIASFTVNEVRIKEALSRNPILVTALNPLIGYAKAAEIAKQAYKEGRPIIDVADEKTDLGRERLTQLLDPELLTGDTTPD
ncbi:class II fumarate hydratase [soil metagenome]